MFTIRAREPDLEQNGRCTVTATPPGPLHRCRSHRALPRIAVLATVIAGAAPEAAAARQVWQTGHQYVVRPPIRSRDSG